MMSDWSAVSVSGGWEDGGDADSRLLAENAELAGRLRLLGPALASLTHDLARVRRENVALRRENLRLRARVTTRASPADAPAKLGAGKATPADRVKDSA
jgi:hypothetical protein